MKQKRLSMATIEKSALLFISKNGLNESRDIPKFIFFLERVEEYGLPKMREIIKKELGFKD